MSEKKYEFTGKQINHLGTTLHQIIAIKDFGTIKKGDIGGWIEKEENLSHCNNCWVSGNASVFDDACVCDDACVYGNSMVFNNAHVRGNAKVYENAEVCGYAWIYGDARVYGYARVFGNAKVYENAEVFGYAWIYGDADVFNNAHVHGNTRVFGNAKVYENAEVFGYAMVCRNARVMSDNDYATISNFGSQNRTTTFQMCKDDIVRVKCGCFWGTINEFRNKVKETHKDSYLAQEYLMIADLMEFRFNNRQNKGGCE